MYAHARVALLACAAMGVSGTLHAQARGSLSRDVRTSKQQIETPPPVVDEATRARRMAEMEAWLGRLVGRFRTEHTNTWGMGQNRTRIHSTAVCSHIGDGPGVRCLIGEPDPRHSLILPGLPVIVSESFASVLPIMYFGINPATLEIQLVLLDYANGGGVGARAGVLAGDGVDFSGDTWKVCHQAPATSNRCWAVAAITATPAGQIHMKFAYDTYFNGRKNSPFDSGHGMYLDVQLDPELSVDAQGPQDAH